MFKVFTFRQTTIADDELRELEKELECPVCMDISRPPIYQCEEGHILCSACKPLLTQCPSCAKEYSNPVIRCRFAEKLSESSRKLRGTCPKACSRAVLLMMSFSCVMTTPLGLPVEPEV